MMINLMFCVLNRLICSIFVIVYIPKNTYPFNPLYSYFLCRKTTFFILHKIILQRYYMTSKLVFFFQITSHILLGEGVTSIN